MGNFKPEGVASTASPDSATTFGAVARKYLLVKEPRWGAHASSTAKSIIHKHLIGNLGPRCVEELTAGEIQLFIDGMVKNSASFSLLNKTVVHLRGILDLAGELNIITRNPMRSFTVEFKYESQKLKSERYLSLEECRALLSVLNGRDRLIVRMFIQLGLWPEELFALRRNDIERDFIRIDEVYTKGQIRKTKPGAAGKVYVPQGLLLELREWITSAHLNEDDWLFSGSRRRASGSVSPLNHNYFRNVILKPAADKASLSNVDLRSLRRTCAALFGESASVKDTQAQMRLSSSVASLEYTPGRLPESLKDAAMALETQLFTNAEFGAAHPGPR